MLSFNCILWARDSQLGGIFSLAVYGAGNTEITRYIFLQCQFTQIKGEKHTIFILKSYDYHGANGIFLLLTKKMLPCCVTSKPHPWPLRPQALSSICRGAL